jgi:hypothetical protein
VGKKKDLKNQEKVTEAGQEADQEMGTDIDVAAILALVVKIIPVKKSSLQEVPKVTVQFQKNRSLREVPKVTAQFRAK